MHRKFGHRILTAALCCSILATVQSAAANTPSAASASIVGYWMGEKEPSTSTDNTESPASYYEPADTSALTPEVWQTLQKYRVPLYMHMRYKRDFGPLHKGADNAAVSLIRKANALGVPVVAWIVIPYEDGYWAYEGNAPAYAEAVKSWIAWKSANKLKFVSVALDQEFSWQNLHSYVPLAMSRDPQKLAAWMEGNINPQAQCRALQTYDGIIASAHKSGVRIDAALAPMVADDLDDGKLALQNSLQMSGSSDYDRKYLMAYRSAVAEAGIDPGSAYAASYFAKMQKYFGASGQVSLGIPGHGPYATMKPLEDDVRMLVGMGAKAIPIYSLEEMIAAFGVNGIRTLAEDALHPMQGAELEKAKSPSPAAAGLLATTMSLDGKAAELTDAVMKRQGIPQSANSWPNGCRGR